MKKYEELVEPQNVETLVSNLKNKLGGILGPIKLAWFLYSKHPELKAKLTHNDYSYSGLNDTETLYLNLVQQMEAGTRREVEAKILEIRAETNTKMAALREMAASIIK